MRGLLGRDSLAPDAGMLFNHTGSVHTYGMRFPIDVVFLDRDMRVLAVNESVGRGKTVKERGARWTLELAAGAAADNGVEPGVTLSYEGSGATVTERRDPESVGSLFRSADDESREHPAGTMVGERAPEHEAPSS
jgi:uncharacterized protein